MERSEKYKVFELEDLPDHFLEVIISKMSLRDAARTSCLSSRWRNLWRYAVTRLNFDAATVLPEDRLDRSETWYIDWVNRVIEQFRDKEFIVNDFRIHYWLGQDGLKIGRKTNVARHLRRWIEFAVAKQAKAIHINLSGYDYYKSALFIRQRCLLSVSQCMGALKGLRNHRSLETLSLRCVHVGREFINTIISECDQLQNLYITWNEKMKDLNVLSSSLRHLQITNNWMNALHTINAPNLETLVYSAERFRPHTLYLPKLISLSIEVLSDPLQDVLMPFGTQIPLHLQYLHLNCAFVEVAGQNFFVQRVNMSNIPLFANVKTLSLNVIRTDMSCKTFIHLVRACPSIEKLKIHVPYGYSGNDEHPNELILQEGMPLCPSLDNLKEIVLDVWDERDTNWGFIAHVIINSPHLEKLIIYDPTDVYGIDISVKALNLRKHLPLDARLTFDSGALCSNTNLLNFCQMHGSVHIQKQTLRPKLMMSFLGRGS